jgi:hypothetical protein
MNKHQRARIEHLIENFEYTIKYLEKEPVATGHVNYDLINHRERGRVATNLLKNDVFLMKKLVKPKRRWFRSRNPK